MDNMQLYEKARIVPQEALKTISAGRLKGMSDVNPMWRIKRLTEMFGPCGVGWWYEITRKEIIFDEITNQKCAFVDINLFYIDAETGHESHAIPGTGGSSFVATERNGPYMSDECYKMALTDAISVAAKALGVAADVYYAKDRTKYTADTVQPEPVPEDALKPGEKVEIPKKKAFDARASIQRWCECMGINGEQFHAYRKALIDGGVVKNIKYDDLDAEELDKLCSAIEANNPNLLSGVSA